MKLDKNISQVKEMEMKLIKMMPLVFMLFANLANSEVLEIYSWKASPGKANDMIERMQAAAKIHSDLGIGVTISSLGLGTALDFDYVLRYDDQESWGRLKDETAASNEWNNFLQEVSDKPVGELLGSFSMVNHDARNMADNFTKTGQVSRVFRWEPAPGAEGAASLRQRFAISKSIHENLGARIETYQVNEGIEGLRDMLYIMIFDSHTHMSEVFAAIGQSSEWQMHQNAGANSKYQTTLKRRLIFTTAANY